MTTMINTGDNDDEGVGEEVDWVVGVGENCRGRVEPHFHSQIVGSSITKCTVAVAKEEDIERNVEDQERTASSDKHQRRWSDLINTLRSLSALTLSPLYSLWYWANRPFLIFDIRALRRSGLSARAPECQKLKTVGYTSMALAEPFKNQQFGTAGVEGVNCRS